MVDKAVQYQAAAQKLRNMSKLTCWAEDYDIALDMGIKALETMYAIEQLIKATPEVKA